jgi:hypothetical protein
MNLHITAEYGVRAFADYVPRQQLHAPDFFDAMLSLEQAVAQRSPYSLQARYIHLLARKQAEAS